MIYVGFINFNDASDKTDELRSVIGLYSQTPSTIIRKNSLTLCYGKLSNTQDMDEVFENTSTILMGRIFDKTQSCYFGKENFQSLSHMDKEKALEKIWGKYVYINDNKEKSQFEVVVDSTGQLPFFYHPFPDGNVLFASNIEIIFKVLAQKPEYNWNYLRSYLIYGNSSAIQTPFQKIYELPPGCCLEITKGERKTKPFWDPLSFYEKASVFEQSDAVDVLQSTLKPLIEPYKNICVSLSGGLDSSSLVYCLKRIKRADQTLRAFNYFHTSVKSSNELIYARKVCEETGIDLIEIDCSEKLPFDPPLKKPLLNPNKPFPGLVSLKWLESVSDHIASNDHSIFLNGHGSDHIFMCPPAKKSLCDYILKKGLKGSKEKLRNIAHFYRDSFFSIFKENVMGLGAYFLSRRLEKRNPKNIQDEMPHWLKQEVHQKLIPDFAHPIYKGLPSQILPGKYQQIDALYDGLASIHMEMDPVNPTCYPFLYEPVVEFALCFHTYDLFAEGYDRYPLRRSVSDHFKTETVWRRDKGETTGFFQLGIKKNLGYVLDLCLKGQFVRQGFIDKDELHKTIVSISNGDSDHMWPFTHLASIEIFLKYWNERIL